LDKDYGKEEITAMKKKSPPNKSPLFKILGEAIGNGASGDPND
jgi:hypothetical protein